MRYLGNKLALILVSKEALTELKHDYPQDWPMWETIQQGYLKMGLDCYLVPNKFGVISLKRKLGLFRSRPLSIAMEYKPGRRKLLLIHYPTAFVPEESFLDLVELLNWLNNLLGSGQFTIRDKEIDSENGIGLRICYADSISYHRCDIPPSIETVQSLLSQCLIALEIYAQAIEMLGKGLELTEMMTHVSEIMQSHQARNRINHLSKHPAVNAFNHIQATQTSSVQLSKSTFHLLLHNCVVLEATTVINLLDNKCLQIETFFDKKIPVAYWKEIISFTTFVNAHLSSAECFLLDSVSNQISCRTGLSLAQYSASLPNRVIESMLESHQETVTLLYPGIVHILNGESFQKAIELLILDSFGGSSALYNEAIAAMMNFIRSTPNYSSEREQTSYEINSFFDIAEDSFSIPQMSDRAKVCERLLKTVSPLKQPVAWSLLQFYLGDSLVRSSIGDRMENFEKAISSFQNALQVQSREKMPLEWSRSQIGLGYAYQNRLRGKLSDNMAVTVSSYENALTFFDKQFMPIQWAQVQHNLAQAHILLQQDGNLEKAIQALSLAMEVRSEQSMPYEWAVSLASLGQAYLLQSYQQPTHLEQAIEAFNNSLTILKREDYPLEWAGVTRLLCSAQLIQANKRDIPLPIQWHSNLENTLPFYPQESMPREHLAVQLQLGRAYFQQQQWQNAIVALKAAFEVSQLIFLDSISFDSKQFELTTNQNNIGQLAYALASLGGLQQAVYYLEAQRTRLLDDALERQALDISQLSKPYQRKYKDLIDSIVRLEREHRAHGESWARDFLTVSDELRQVRREIQELIQLTRQQQPGFMSREMPFDEIQQLARSIKTPIVYLSTTEHGSLALFIFPSVNEPICVTWLNSFRGHDLNNMLHSSNSRTGYLESIILGNEEAIKDVLTTMGQNLSEKVIEPISQLLNQHGYHNAVLIPTGGLGLLPLHALPPDPFTFTLTPSVRALKIAKNTVSVNSQAEFKFLGLGNPNSANLQPLTYAATEVERICAITANNADYLLGQDCKVATLNTFLTRASYLHFACHGHFSVENPLESAIYLSGHERLSLRNILDQTIDLTQLRLVVLSACQTGIFDFQNIPDEAFGFSSGFLQAGVPAVISSLWTVNDLSTMLLMEHFYQLHLQDGLEIAQALRQAQLWLRDVTAGELADRFGEERMKIKGNRLTLAEAGDYWRRFAAVESEERPFAHPYYWAAFTFTGA